MPPKFKRQRRRGRGGATARMRQQIATIKQELRDSNTGRFSKRTACIRLPHHNRFTKIYRKVRLQHNSTAETSGTVILANVHASVAPQFGWYNVTCSNHVRIV